MPEILNRLPTSGRRESERAVSFGFTTCGGCPHLHVYLKDAEGNIYADMVIQKEQLSDLFIRGRALIALAEEEQKRGRQ